MSQPLTYDSDDPLAVWDGPYHWDEQLNQNPTTIMADTQVSYPVQDVLGFCASAKDMVNNYKTRMVAAGVDPTAMLTQLDPAQVDLTSKNTVQENLKTQMRNQTPLVDAARDKAYTIASNLCDKVISAFGRTSEEAQEATNLRKKMHPNKTQSAAAKAAKAAAKT